MGGMESIMPPVFSKLQESWSKVSHCFKRNGHIFSMTCFLQQWLVKWLKNPPPMEIASAHLCLVPDPRLSLG